MSARFRLISGWFMFWSVPLCAQYTDTELWLGSGINQTLTKQWSWSLQWENRWTQDWNWHEQGLVDVAMEYRLNKHWDANVQWRFSERRELDGGYVPRRRAAVRLLGAWNVGPGKLTTRGMLTEDWNPRAIGADIGGIRFAPTARVRAGYALSVSNRIKSEISWELFKRGGPNWSERWQWSIEREMTDQLDLELAYLWGNEWNTWDPWRSHVLRIKVNWKLPKPGKQEVRTPKATVYQEGVPIRTLPRESCPPCDLDQLRISEVHPKGSPSDYIEVHNASDAPCSLLGWSLTESLTESGWSFGPVCLPPMACWLGYDGGKNSFGFGLSSEGEALFLVAPNRSVYREYTVLPAELNQAQGLDKTGNWGHSTPTPGRVQTDK